MRNPQSREHLRSNAEGPPAASAKRIALAGAALTALLGIAAFSEAHRSGFVQDDVPMVQNNLLVRAGSLGQLFATDYTAGAGGQEKHLYRPVTMASFALERGPEGVVPARAHLLNLAIHLMVGLLLLRLALRLGLSPWTASVAASLFAVHPVHTAAVVGLVGRAELLAGVFVVGAVWIYTAAGAWPGASEPSPATSRAAAWAAAACVFLAAGSKEIGLVALPLLMVVDLIYRWPPRGAMRAWLVDRGAAVAPAVLAVVVHIVMRVRAIDAFPGLQSVFVYENPIVALDGIERLATTLAVAARYVRLLFWPFKLSADYSGTAVAVEPSLLAPLPILGAVVLVAGALVATSCWWWRGAGTARRAAALASAMALGSYALVGNLIVLSGQVLAERFIYVPSLGFILAVTIGLFAVGRATVAWRPHWQRAIRAVAAGSAVTVMLVGIVATRATVREWMTDETLYVAARRHVPKAPRASATLAKLRLEQGRIDEAMALIDETLELWPEQSGALVDRGLVLANSEKYAAAAEAFRAASRVNPYNETAAVSLGLALARLDRLEDAEHALRAAVRRFPEQAKAWVELGNVADRLGRPAEAIAAWRTAERLGRTDLGPRIRERELQLAAASPGTQPAR